MENQNLPKIYSNKVILGFSIFLSTLFGGILMYQNLKDLHKNKEANIVLGTSILLTILTLVIVNIPETPKSSLSYLCGLTGGGILTYFFAPKYIPNESEYPKKAIWKPLIIGIIIVGLLFTFMIYANEQGI